MSAILAALSTLWTLLRLWAGGLWALVSLSGIGLGALVSGDGAAALARPATWRKALAVLRAFWPNLRLGRSFVKACDNTGTLVITRHNDCLDVLARDADFEVVYGPRMQKLTGGRNFFLGMQPGWDYTRDTSAMRLAMRSTDVAERILPRAQALAEEIVVGSGGRIDLPPQLTLQVPWDMTRHYFGTPGPDAATMQDWTTTLFWYLFEDLGADPALETRAMDQAAQLRAYLDGVIAARHAAPTEAPDLVNRCLALQAAGTPGMDDTGIRNNILGLQIGAIPTLSKASCRALDELLNRPDALRGAMQAARSDDDARLARYIWEALRFNPHNPVIYRRATRDTVVGRSTLRQQRVRKGDMVFAATLSAMFDPLAIPHPERFCTDRPWETYIIWGYGMHRCFGEAINRVVIPAMLKPLLRQKNLRRAPGVKGRIDTGGTPYPQHFQVEFDP